MYTTHENVHFFIKLKETLLEVEQLIETLDPNDLCYWCYKDKP